MYQDFFQLNQRPFSASPNPELLYEYTSLKRSLSELENSLRAGEGLSMLTAEAGLGKTLVCKTLQTRLKDDPLPVLLLHSGVPDTKFTPASDPV